MHQLHRSHVTCHENDNHPLVKVNIVKISDWVMWRPLLSLSCKLVAILLIFGPENFRPNEAPLLAKLTAFGGLPTPKLRAFAH